ncbi:hypothetical protein C8A03DRAFT_15011 [Achaetomium macrosporum]|uniref:Uncharacterized protein n=1 Tax=Achaetomium macrosporum TaxID=79813 RepID=A0AAN7CAM1_9PEZI|nr:hypothetical protein C8A03DRAFT_15011 [Achaetomium macrosporum]
MGKHISTPIFIIAIVVSIFGSALLSILGVYLFLRRRREARRQRQEHEKVASAALDRAIVSYIAKELSGEQGASDQQAPEPLELAMSTAADANMKDMEVDRRMDIHRSEESPTPSVERIPSLRRSETSITDTVNSLPRLTFSHFADSVEQVYGDILARPLERVSIHAAPSLPKFVPPARDDDVGWPLTKETQL